MSHSISILAISIFAISIFGQDVRNKPRFYGGLRQRVQAIQDCEFANAGEQKYRIARRRHAQQSVAGQLAMRRC